MALVAEVYRATARFPHDEVLGLAAQIRQAALSVPSYLAEGTMRDTVNELTQFLGMSGGSIAALDTQLEIAVRLGYLAPDAAAVTRTRRLGHMVSRLRESLSKEAVEERSFSDVACVGGTQRGKRVSASPARAWSPFTGHRSSSAIS